MLNKSLISNRRLTVGKKKSHSLFVTCFLLIFAYCLPFTACNSVYVQKPTGYFAISFPEKKYQLFNQAGYPYSFEYPQYASITKDTSFFGGTTENPWWINVEFPQFHGRIYISYKEIGKYTLEKLLNDAFNLTNKHSEKANGINQSLIETPNNIHGMLFNVEGDVATANQFFVTDSIKHFLRGALYFDATPNADSLQPVNAFLLEDMKHLINTFRWK